MLSQVEAAFEEVGMLMRVLTMRVRHEHFEDWKRYTREVGFPGSELSYWRSENWRAGLAALGLPMMSERAEGWVSIAATNIGAISVAATAYRWGLAPAFVVVIAFMAGVIAQRI
jgi:hypothetical protein